MSQVVAAFRKTDAVKGIRAGCYDSDCVRIGKPRVFAGRNQHAAEDKMRILACAHHACKPVHCGIRVAAAQGFYECRNNVVVVVAVAVVQNDFFLNRFFGRFLRNIDFASPCRNGICVVRLPFFRGSFHGKFQCVQQGTGIAVGGVH